MMLTAKHKMVIWCGLVVIGAALAGLLPGDAFDWRVFFGQGNIPAHYPPWTGLVVSVLTYPLVVGITLASFGIAALLRARSPLHSALAFLNLPLFWTIFLGQLDGLVLLGTLALPWLLPLALLKPQVAGWVLFARPRLLPLALLFVLLTFLVWGPWPVDILTYARDPGDWPQDIAGWGGIALLCAFVLTGTPSSNDPDWWMLAGACITPVLIPYNLLPLMPVIARLPAGWAVAAAVTSWLPLLANWVGDWGWQLGWVSLAAIGLGLRSLGRENREHGSRL